MKDNTNNIKELTRNLDNFLMSSEYVKILKPKYRTYERMKNAYDLYESLANAYYENGNIEMSQGIMRVAEHLFLDLKLGEFPVIEDKTLFIITDRMGPWMNSHGMGDEIKDFYRAVLEYSSPVEEIDLDNWGIENLKFELKK